MNNNVKQKKKFPVTETIILAVITMFAISLGIWAIIFRETSFPNPIQRLDKTVSDTNDNSIQNPDSIAIPGYGSITLKADRIEQNVSFNNPEQNQCYFVICLYLADGTLLWKSDYVCPGDSADPLILLQTLDEGVYEDAILEYLCFAMDGRLSPLNVAKTKLTLRFK